MIIKFIKEQDMGNKTEKGIIASGKPIDGKSLRSLRRLAGSDWSLMKDEIVNHGTQVFWKNNKIVGFSYGSRLIGIDQTDGLVSQVFSGMHGEPQGWIRARDGMNEYFENAEKDITKGDRQHNSGNHMKKYSHAQVAKANLRIGWTGKRTG